MNISRKIMVGGGGRRMQDFRDPPGDVSGRFPKLANVCLSGSYNQHYCSLLFVQVWKVWNLIFHNGDFVSDHGCFKVHEYFYVWGLMKEKLIILRKNLHCKHLKTATSHLRKLSPLTYVTQFSYNTGPLNWSPFHQKEQPCIRSELSSRGVSGRLEKWSTNLLFQL